MARFTKADREAATERLLRWLKPGDTVWTILRHRSTSGMLRVISAIQLDCEDGKVQQVGDLSYNVAQAIGYGFDERHEGVRVGGAGMDMGFHLVYSLGWHLWPDGFDCIGEGCPSNDHSNGLPRTKQYTAETCPGRPCSDGCDHRGVPDVHHRDGGYALLQRWL